jgi:hypothetical protein
VVRDYGINANAVLLETREIRNIGPKSNTEPSPPRILPRHQASWETGGWTNGSGPSSLAGFPSGDFCRGGGTKYVDQMLCLRANDVAWVLILVGELKPS